MIELLLAELERAQKTYKPNEAVRARLREITFVPVIGPFLTGKSTVMAAAARLDRSFGRVRSFTTRERRAGEPEDLYEFLPHTEATLRKILSEVNAHELVQFTLHPTTGAAYGSRLSAWHRQFMMLDIVPHALEAMRSFEFKTVRPIALAVDAKEWTERLHSREDDAEERIKRLREGISNVEWCLAHDVAWLNNSSRTPEDAARQLIAIAEGTSRGDASGAAVAEGLLEILKAMI
ncbi:MAG TPA: hypothetical protein VIM53_02845 [Candidatus Saccharimonadales bacterium]